MASPDAHSSSVSRRYLLQSPAHSSASGLSRYSALARALVPNSNVAPANRRRQGIFWLLTIPFAHFTPWLPPACRWIRGQLESGADGYLHWQVIVALRTKGSMATLRLTFGPYHAELSRSDAASEYVWKEQTRVAGTQFEIGTKPCDPSAKPDW